MQDKNGKAVRALKKIIPLLKKYHFQWIITGGFACYVYGVKRNLTDIDIDIKVNKDSVEFKAFLAELKLFITQPLEHFIDKNYDNYNFEITINGQVIDICPMADLKIFDKNKKKYVPFYSNGFPKIEKVKFKGVTLPLLSKELIIKNKEMLVWQRESDLRDIEGLKIIIQKEGNKLKDYITV